MMTSLARVIPRSEPPEPATSRSPKISGTYAVGEIDHGLHPYEGDEPTPVKLICLACKAGGYVVKEFSSSRHSKVHCKWCSDGTMSGEQVNAYVNREHRLDDELKGFLQSV